MTASRPRGNVAVVGSGAMGTGIAQVAATAGHHVYLQDAGANRAAAAAEGLSQRLDLLAGKGRITADAARDAVGRLHVVAELTDLIGQDVNLAVGTSVWERTGNDPRYAPVQLQRDLVTEGRLGRKTGHGIYSYAVDGRPTEASPDERRVAELVGGPVLTDPVARTVAMLVNEAVDLVHRGEATPEDVDTAMVLGTSYPKGPIAWGHELGYDRIRSILAELDDAYPGGRYRPSPALEPGS